LLLGKNKKLLVSLRYAIPTHYGLDKRIINYRRPSWSGYGENHFYNEHKYKSI